MQVSQDDDDTGVWRLDRATVLSKLKAAKELDRDAKGAPREGHDKSRRMDDYETGSTAEGRAADRVQSRGTRTRRPKGDLAT